MAGYNSNPPPYSQNQKMISNFLSVICKKKKIYYEQVCFLRSASLKNFEFQLYSGQRGEIPKTRLTKDRKGNGKIQHSLMKEEMKS